MLLQVVELGLFGFGLLSFHVTVQGLVPVPAGVGWLPGCGASGLAWGRTGGCACVCSWYCFWHGLRGLLLALSCCATPLAPNGPG